MIEDLAGSNDARTKDRHFRKEIRFGKLNDYDKKVCYQIFPHWGKNLKLHSLVRKCVTVIGKVLPAT